MNAPNRITKLKEPTMTMFTTASHHRTVFSVPSLFRAIWAAYCAHEQRNALKSLDDSRLRDLGLTYRQALHEAKRPVWDVPGYWRR